MVALAYILELLPDLQIIFTTTVDGRPTLIYLITNHITLCTTLNFKITLDLKKTIIYIINHYFVFRPILSYLYISDQLSPIVNLLRSSNVYLETFPEKRLLQWNLNCRFSHKT